MMKKVPLFFVACLLLIPSAHLPAQGGGDLKVYVERAAAAAKRHDYESAQRDFDTAVREYPKNPMAYYYRGSFYADLHKNDLALKDFDTALTVQPTLWQAAVARGFVWAEMGRYDKALADYNKVVSLHPSGETLASVLNDRAWIEATCPDARFRDGKKAAADAKQALASTKIRKASCLDSLAAANAELGDFDSAVKYEQQAIAAQTGSDRLLDPPDRLNSYRQHQAYRDKARH